MLLAPPEWRRLVFFSDLHLGPDTPATQAALERELASLQADAVFILGDLFEAWVGDDALQLPWARRVADALKDCSTRSALYFQHGNRDFLLGPKMAQACGMQLLDEEACLHAFGQCAVLVHGDAQCLDDVAYQTFRAQVRQSAWQQQFLALPLDKRLELAAQMRDASRQSQGAAQGDAPYGDLDGGACEALLLRFDAQTLVHGHTHRMADHPLRNGTRRVLPDWDFDHAEHGARGGFLVWTAEGWRREALA